VEDLVFIVYDMINPKYKQMPHCWPFIWSGVSEFKQSHFLIKTTCPTVYFTNLKISSDLENSINEWIIVRMLLAQIRFSIAKAIYDKSKIS